MDNVDEADEFLEHRSHPGVTIADLADAKLRDPTALRSMILDVMTRGLYEQKERFDKRGRRRGNYWGYTRVTFRRVGRIIGCSHQHVIDVVRKQVR